MDSRHGRPRTVDFWLEIKGKIISRLLLPSAHDFWRFCCFISSRICKVCKLLGVHKERILAVLFFVLEVVSVVLDLIGKDKLAYLLAAFLLSAFGFAMTLYSFIEARTNPTITAEMQLKVVEIVFSVIQLIVTLVQYLLTVLKVKNDYNASAFPLAFAMIAIVFIFIKDGKTIDSSPKDWPLPKFQPVGSITSNPNELDQSGSSVNQVDPMSSIVKRSTHVRNQKAVFQLELNDDETRNKAMETVIDTSGVDSILVDLMKDKLTMIGNIDPLDIGIELRTICRTELVSVEPAKEEKKKYEKKDERIEDLIRVYQRYEPENKAYYPYKRKEEKKKEYVKKDDMKKEEPIEDLIRAYQRYEPENKAYYPYKRKEEKKIGTMKEEAKKEVIPDLVKAYKAYNPYKTPYYHIKSE